MNQIISSEVTQKIGATETLLSGEDKRVQSWKKKIKEEEQTEEEDKLNEITSSEVKQQIGERLKICDRMKTKKRFI